MSLSAVSFVDACGGARQAGCSSHEVTCSSPPPVHSSGMAATPCLLFSWGCDEAAVGEAYGRLRSFFTLTSLCKRAQGGRARLQATHMGGLRATSQGPDEERPGCWRRVGSYDQELGG